jgi:hypothetical protein
LEYLANVCFILEGGVVVVGGRVVVVLEVLTLVGLVGLAFLKEVLFCGLGVGEGEHP